MRKADNLPPSCAVVTKSGILNFLEPSGLIQACNGTAWFLLFGTTSQRHLSNLNYIKKKSCFFGSVTRRTSFPLKKTFLQHFFRQVIDSCVKQNTTTGNSPRHRARATSIVSSMYCTAAIIWLKHNYFSSITQQPLVDQGLFIIEASLSHSHSHTTLGRTPLDKRSNQRRYLYPKTHNTHKRQTSMRPVRFEPAIPVSEQSQTHALDRAYEYYSRNFTFRQHLLFLSLSS